MNIYGKGKPSLAHAALRNVSASEANVRASGASSLKRPALRRRQPAALAWWAPHRLEPRHCR